MYTSLKVALVSLPLLAHALPAAHTGHVRIPISKRSSVLSSQGIVNVAALQNQRASVHGCANRVFLPLLQAV